MKIFTVIDWNKFQWIAGKKRGNGKYNPARLYQGFATLYRKSAR